LGIRLMAIGCSVCPFCIAARRWPNSRYAKMLRVAEKSCPFCRAYARVHGGRAGEQDGE